MASRSNAMKPSDAGPPEGLQPILRGHHRELLLGRQQGFAPDVAVESSQSFTVKEGPKGELQKSRKQLGFRGDGVAPKQGEISKVAAIVGQDDLVLHATHRCTASIGKADLARGVAVRSVTRFHGGPKGVM